MGRYDREEKLRLQLNIAIGELLYSLPIDLGGVLKGGVRCVLLYLQSELQYDEGGGERDMREKEGP